MSGKLLSEWLPNVSESVGQLLADEIFPPEPDSNERAVLESYGHYFRIVMNDNWIEVHEGGQVELYGAHITVNIFNIIAALTKRGVNLRLKREDATL